MVRLWQTLLAAFAARGGRLAWAVLFCFCLAAPHRLGGQSQTPSDGADGEGPGGMQLVDVDQAAEERLQEIAGWAEQKRYSDAVDALHALMTAQDKAGLTLAPGPGRRYGTPVDAAARLLATLPDEALDLYVKRHELAAKKLFDQARHDRDEARLLSAGRCYFHTLDGAKALSLAAAIAFDKGGFLQAAALWERLAREHRRLPTDRALLLTKACAAYRLAGLPEKAASLAQQVKEQHAAAAAAVAGQRVLLAAFVEKVLAAEPHTSRTPLKPVSAWPSAAGAPDGVAVMVDCDAAPLPIRVEPESVRAGLLEALLGVGIGGGASPDGVMAVAFDSGRVRIRKFVPGQPAVAFDLPPLVHPVTVGGMLLSRLESAVVAVSLESGKELWRTRDLPMHVEAPGSDGSGGIQLALAGDMGRYTLTVGDGRAYTVCKFSRLGRPTWRLSDGDTTAAGDGSSLVALSVRPDGAQVAWEIGGGKGSDELLRQAKYLSAPTFHEGRLYVLARRANRYHALCLSAADGTLHWETPLGLVPMRGGAMMSWHQAYALEVTTERGSLPAVADGMAYFATNAGIVEALDTVRGEPVWAHQYDSAVTGSSEKASTIDLQGQAIRVATLRQPYWPVNPLVVAQGRLVCLPCDSDSVLALHAQRGDLLWRRSRQGQRDLTALDEETVLLSGPDVLTLDLCDGAGGQRRPNRILGRPAVTAESILAAGEGSIVRVDRARGVVEARPVPEAGAALGRLVLAEGRLAAACAAGWSLYADYDTTWGVLRSALDAEKQPARRAALGMRAGMLALSADRLADAAEQLTAAKDEARRAGDSPTADRLDCLLFEARMRQYRAAGGKEDAGRFLDQAARHASTAAQRRQVLVEQVRHQEALGRPAEAARQAQAAVDVQAERWWAGAETALPEYFLARSEIARLIGKYGRDVYAPFDAKMSAALDRASAKQDVDAMVAAARRWPHAARRGEALLKAGEILFQRAVSLPRPDVELAMKASRILGEASSEMQQEARVQALAAQVVVDLRFRPHLASVLAGELRAFAPATPVRFGEFSGTVQELLARAEEARKRPLPPEDPEFGALRLPLRLAYEAPTGAVSVLRGARGRAVRVGERLFLCTEGELICLDAGRDDADSARLWSVELPQRPGAIQRVGQLSSDGRRVAILERDTLLAVDVLSGKVAYRNPLDWMGPRGWIRAVGEGDWLAVADYDAYLTCLNIATGKRVWRTRILGFDIGATSAWGEILLLSYPGRSAYVCWDIRTQRVLADLGARHGDKTRTESALLTPEGLVVTRESDGTMGVRDVRLGGAGGKRTANWGDGDWRGLAAGRRFVGFRAPAGGGGTVRVLDLSDPAQAIELKVDDDAGQARQPVHLAFRGRRALLLHAGEARAGELTGPQLAAFALPEGKRLWNRALAPAAAGPCRTTPLHVYGDTLSLAVAPTAGPQPVRQYVVRIEDGEMFDCSSALASPLQVPAPPASPVVLNGRVLVPTPAGAACLVGARP